MRPLSVGAECMPGGGVDFRVWAPGHQIVELVFEHTDKPCQLRAEADGYFSAHVEHVGLGHSIAIGSTAGPYPEPVSRFQPAGPDRPSEVVNPRSYAWNDETWRGQLTWMDAKRDGWAVTPRRGKAVEINALWYNALMNLARWLDEESQPQAAAAIAQHAKRVESAFNARFFCVEKQYLYDVVDGEDGSDESSLRPNQLFTISLPQPALQCDFWKPVLHAVSEALVTPVGLRSLSRDSRDYKPNADAWLKVYPNDSARVRSSLSGLVTHLGEAGIGSISEVFDAEPPFTARGCVAQAWGVAELLRVGRNVQRPIDAAGALA